MNLETKRASVASVDTRPHEVSGAMKIGDGRMKCRNRQKEMSMDADLGAWPLAVVALAFCVALVLYRFAGGR